MAVLSGRSLSLVDLDDVEVVFSDLFQRDVEAVSWLVDIASAMVDALMRSDEDARIQLDWIRSNLEVARHDILMEGWGNG